MSPLLKNLLIALTLVVILFAGYLIFVRGNGIPTPTRGDSEMLSQQAQLESQKLLVTLNELKEFKVDGAVLTDVIFSSLRDFRTDLGSEPSGRSNPFLRTE